MDAERARAFVMTLPHAVETHQWGDNLVFWVGDKAIGGKMFALVNLDPGESHGAVSYSAGPERFAELVEIDGLKPAPYMARIFWVATERWSVFRNAEWEAELTAAHAITYAKLPPKVKTTLDLPAADLKRLVAERTKLLAEKKAKKKA
jgi:predicted DNA-binding protein (MmcQ/YjbR family)